MEKPRTSLSQHRENTMVDRGASHWKGKGNGLSVLDGRVRHHTLSLSLPSRPRCNLFSFAHVTNSIHPALNLSLFLSRLIPIERRHCHPAHKTPPPLRGRHNFKFYAIYKMSRHYFCPLDLSLHTFGPSDNPIYVGVPPSPVIVCHRNARNLLLAVLSFPHQYFAALIK